MPIIESTQHKLDRIWPPRVQITYDVETGGAMEQVELPFVLGILADLSGSTPNTFPLKDPNRRFLEIDRDNFFSILRNIAPTLSNLTVENRLPGAKDGEKLPLNLTFTSMDDFNPTSIVRQVTPLRELLEARQRLRDLQAKLDGNDHLHSALLDQIVQATNYAGGTAQ
jgi:type VI secretion system protein ImpB